MNLDLLPEPCKEKDLAKLLGVSVYTVRAMCDDGQITYRKIRSRRVFLREDVQQYWDEIKCRNEIEDTSLNGGKNVQSGKSAGTSKAAKSTSLQAQKTATRLIDSYRNTSKEPASEKAHGSLTMQ